MKEAIEEMRVRIEGIERQVGILPDEWKAPLAEKKAPAKKPAKK